MKGKKNIFLIALYTVLFSILIFIGGEILFPSSLSEERYIEPRPGETYIDLSSSEEYTSFSGASLKDANTIVQDLLYQRYKSKYSALQKDKVKLRYVPSALEDKVQYSYSPLVETFVYSTHILPHIDDLDVLMYQSITDTRGRMKSKDIHMYGVLERTDEEFLAVLTHEFAHYFDIYSLDKTAF